MNRLTYAADYCTAVAYCDRSESCCGKNGCRPKQIWERLKEYEDTGLTPEEVRVVTKEEKP